MSEFKTALQPAAVTCPSPLLHRLLAFTTMLFAVTLMTACAAGSRDLVSDKDMVGASIAAVGHLGSGIGIPEFSVNGHWDGNNSGWGGGGGGVCCVLMPRKVTKPLMVTVKWETYRSNVGEDLVHEATVPVHFAVEPEDSSGLNVHFLPGNRVEVWMARGYPEGSEYPGPKYPSGPAPAYAPLPDEKPLSPTSDLQNK